MFAAIPLIFAAQQAAEGIVWLTVAAPAQTAVNRFAVLAFLGLALIVWPTWLPVALRRVEQDAGRCRILTALFRLGVCVAVSASVLLMRWRPVSVVAGHSLRYDRAGSSNAAGDLLVLLAYSIPTIVPFFVSTVRLARTIGATLVLSLMATAMIEKDATTSVWCFFAAILSCLVLAAVTREQRAAGTRAAIDPLVPVTDQT